MKLSPKQKLRARWFATGRPAVGKLSVFYGVDCLDFYVGKLRGKIVADPESGNFQWFSRQGAWTCAVRFREHARKLAA